MTVNQFWIFLLVVTATWIVMMVITVGPLFCRTTFGGVWSSIVIDDCTGSFWDLPGADAGPWPLERGSDVKYHVGVL